MATPQEMRRIRLRNDYAQMVNLNSQGNLISWVAVGGQAPEVEAYELTIRVRSFVDASGRTRGEHTMRLELPADYPTSPPRIAMTSRPYVFHPNWWPMDGAWCYGRWMPAESLGNHVIRMIRTLQFDPEITNPDSPANRDAKEWYLRQRSRSPGDFPCDQQALPDPTKNTRWEVTPQKRFEILS